MSKRFWNINKDVRLTREALASRNKTLGMQAKYVYQRQMSILMKRLAILTLLAPMT
jgi:hypothetical protein